MPHSRRREIRRFMDRLGRALPLWERAAFSLPQQREISRSSIARLAKYNTKPALMKFI